MKNSFLLSLCLLFCISLTSAYAASCNTTGLPANLLLGNARPYNDIGSDFTFKAFYLDNQTPITNNGTNVTLTFDNTTYGMTYNPLGYWEITITSTDTEDILLDINASSPLYACKETSFTTRFRTPFYVTFKLYQHPLNDSNPSPYLNDFQYVILADKNSKVGISPALSFINSANSIVGSFDSSIGVNVNQHVRPDPTVYFWARYFNGEATVKLYEPSNYSVYVLSNKVQYSNSQFWEFQKPTDNNPSFTGTILSTLAIYNATNVSDTPRAFNNTVVSISLSKFEVNAYYVFLNWIKIVVVVIFYIALVALTIYVFGDNPNGWRYILSVILAGGAVVIGLIWGIG